MKPMLAHRYKDHISKVAYPIFLQPKLNGVRCLYRNGYFQTRDQHLWNSPVLAHIAHHLAHVPWQITLDGELYFHGWSRQKINGAVSINRNEPNDDTLAIQYHIFDMFDHDFPDLPFSERMDDLTYNYFDGLTAPSVQLVPTHLAHDQPYAERLYARLIREKFEGMMYRFDEPYGILKNCSNKENRWTRLLKRKDFLDDWFPCVGVTEGSGKHLGRVGSLILKLPDGQTFTASSGLSDIQRYEYLDRFPRRVHIKYETLSDDGIPLIPTIEETED